MNTIEKNEVSQVAKVETVEKTSFSILGNKIEIQALENAINKVNSDAGRIAQLCKDNGLGGQVKSITGGAVKVVTVAAVRELGKRGLLGDKDKTKARIANVVALNALVDALATFGLAKRIAE